MADTPDELAGLTDFQQRTARYAFRRLYLDPDPTRRFLVADEVGLGKTLVARAVVAQAITHLRQHGKRRIDIVYMCSNSAIVKQNLRKLSPVGLTPTNITGRLSLLPGQPPGPAAGVNFVALTPGTSLQHGTALGTVAERALAIEFVASVFGRDEVEHRGVYRAFAGNIKDREGSLRELRTRFAEARGSLTPAWGAKGMFARHFRDVDAEFRAVTGWRMRETLGWLAAEFDRDARRRDPDADAVRNVFIGRVRRAMAATGAELLRPNLVIFDEFQRFADLLHSTEPEIKPLMDSLTGSGGDDDTAATRALLLSATPYRMHTTDVERAAGENDHYGDLLRTVEFLAGKSGADGLATDLRQLRSALNRIAGDGLDPVVTATRSISERLRTVMVRTERLASTADRDGMLRTVTHTVNTPDADEIRGYLAATRLAGQVAPGDHPRALDLVELWKSVPYLLSFLHRDNYQVKATLHEAIAAAEKPATLTDGLVGTTAVVPWSDVDAYREVPPANARLRQLLSSAAGPVARDLLWMPASAPYYRADGEFESPQAREFTKHLVFSAWHAVPNSISAMLSYEVERATIGAHSDVTYADAASKAVRPLRIDAETTYLLLYPSVALADLVDPLAIRTTSGGVPPTWHAVAEAAGRVLGDRIDRLTAGHRGRPTDPRWYWLAPLLLDHESHRRGKTTAATVDPVGSWTEEGADTYRSRMDEWRGIAASGAVPGGLGAPPDDLVEVLTEVALASPAVCALRAIRRVLPAATPYQTLPAAARVAFGIRAMFNGPEATAIVAGRDHDVFWRECLGYAARGNLQAVLDEYLHVLAEWQRFDVSTLSDLAEHVYRAATLRAVPYQVDVLDAAGGLNQRHMRGRYAARFGHGRDDTNGEVRAEQVSEAFNSPFWPFVLATTSIGQEGLDFHLYCHAVVHWNLPHNPVDLEQREGRVHRYKGHAVRKNVADRCGLPASPLEDPWRAMFETAAGHRSVGESEIVPYWVFEGPANIERHLLVAPYTRDASVLPHLLDSTVMYRIAFGQPRQEELLRNVASATTPEQRQALSRIRVDLRPPAE
ncbi:DEAD/DEAH box helicase [Micromonospora sp. NBC_01699]|uniref:DEAD/DEAH box helicase n=1 Tax=Micromonospora sp. NBC_01699 TaxID=2975984 RepID=UPI002E3159B9|nr:DEAD/DEAH box helicase [Micromonospora sp. NBC_01699]